MLQTFKYIVLLLSIITPAVSAFLLLSTKLNINKHKKYLFFLFADVALVFAITFFKYTGQLAIYSNVFPIQIFFSGSVFPIFYLYVKQLTNPYQKEGTKALAHFIVPITTSIFFLIFMYGAMSVDERNIYMFQYIFQPDISNKLLHTLYVFERSIRLIFIAQTLFYVVKLIQTYREHTKNISNRFSWREGIDLKWLNTTTLIVLLSAFINVILQIMQTNNLLSQDFTITISYSVFICTAAIMAYYTLKQKDIYNDKTKEIEEKIILNTTEITANVFERYIKEQKPYLKAELSIFDLCSAFNSNRTYISNFINTEFKMNFRTLINTYRIEDAKIRITEMETDSTLTMESIAQSCGFKSYSTFLRCFKTHTGIPPSEYRDSLK